MSKKRSFRERLEEAKGIDYKERFSEVDLKEIGEGMKVWIYPMTGEGYKDLLEYRKKGGLLESWGLVLVSARDENGDLAFTENDVEFLETMGLIFKAKLINPSMRMSGLSQEFITEKKPS